MSNSLSISELENAPCSNSRAITVPCGDTGFVFLYGGFDDTDALDSNVYLLDLAEKSWEIDDKHQGVEREGHSAVYIGNGNVLVFGGIPYDEPTGTVEVIDTGDARLTNSETANNFKKDSLMMIYNIYEKKWIGAPGFALDNAPSARYRHACCVSPDGSKIYISGGLVREKPMDDLYCYDLTSGSWTGPIRFVARFDHFITIHGDKLFAFGGLDKDMILVNDYIVYYSLVNGAIGKVSILQRPNYGLTNAGEGVGVHSENNSAPGGGSSNDQIISRSKIYIDSEINSSIKLDIRVPIWNAEPPVSLSYVNLDEYEYHDLFDMDDLVSYFKKNGDINFKDYLWRKPFATKSGSLYFLGNHYSYEHSLIPTDSPKLSCLLEVKLAHFGIPTIASPTSQQRANQTPLSKDFEALLLNQEFTDFEIHSLENDLDKHSYADVNFDDQQTNKFNILKVHKSILLARWPHFQRLISVGMNETAHGKMFIPEHHTLVKGLMFYLYTGSIEFSSQFVGEEYDIVDYSGLLVLANMYELGDLRSLVLFKLFQLFDQLTLTIETGNEFTDTLIRLWSDLSFSNESVFIVKILEMIRKHWAVVTRSKSFFELSKDSIIKLCQECSSDGPFQSSSGVSNTSSVEISPASSNRASFELIEENLGMQAPDTPLRCTNSPFMIESPRNNHNPRSNIETQPSLSSIHSLPFGGQL